MQQMQFIFTIYDNIFQLFNDIVHTDNIKLISYFPSSSESPWIENKDKKYTLYYSVNNNGLKMFFKCIVDNEGNIKEQFFENYDKRSLTED